MSDKTSFWGHYELIGDHMVICFVQYVGILDTWLSLTSVPNFNWTEKRKKVYLLLI